MLASLISRLRDRIAVLERRRSKGKLEQYWDLLRRAEKALYEEWNHDAMKDIERELKKKLGVVD